jgi:hypothetical protein
MSALTGEVLVPVPGASLLDEMPVGAELVEVMPLVEAGGVGAVLPGLLEDVGSGKLLTSASRVPAAHQSSQGTMRRAHPAR